MGWQVYPQLWGGNDARLFVYSTSDGYSANNFASGCYNVTCGRFVQTNSAIVLGGPLASYSTSGGSQSEITLLAFRDDGSSSNHDWWIYVNGVAVGYYPNSLYSSTGLADKNARIDFGGELVNDQTNGVNTSTQMGSGAFPSAGFQYAAYIKKIQYLDMSFNYQNAASLSPGVSFPYLWDMSAVTYSSDPNWLTYFYFGGPGNKNYTVSVSASPPAGGSVSGGGSFAAGATPSVTATPNSGYAFVNWTEGANVVSTSTSYLLPQIVASHTLVANFSSQSPAVMSTPTPGTTLSGSSLTFSWTAGVGVTDYFLSVGNSVGDHTWWNQDEGTSHSQTVTGLPTDGRTLYVRLYSKINGIFQYHDYTYTAPNIAVMLTPTPATTLSGSSVTFNWTAGASVTDYFLSIGNNPGASDHTWWFQDEGLNASQSVTGLPTDGRTLYVRLYSKINGIYYSNDYFYTAANTVTNYTVSVSASPAAGGTVGGGGSFAGGSSRTVTATANSGYRFVSWTENGSVVSSLTSYTFTLNTNRTFVANFTPTSATALSSNSNPAIYGAPVTFTVNVTGGAPTPTGNVLIAFGDGNNTNLILASGSATVNHIYSSVGTYTVTASYSGDGTHNSSSDSLMETVQKGITLSFVSDSPNSSIFGQNVTITATATTLEASGALPSGTVTFSDGGTVIGSGTLSNNTASIFYSGLTAGSHFITANYAGDTNYFGSSSSSATQNVSKGNTTTAIANSPNSSDPGQSVTFTANVAVTSPAAGSPTGSVTFKDGASTIGSSPISNGSAQFSTSALSLGLHTITAVYSGDANFSTSMSSGTMQNISAMTTAYLSMKSGHDTGICPITAPCASLNYALSVSSGGGQVIVLDSGVFSPIVLTQAISIVGFNSSVQFEIAADASAQVGCIGALPANCGLNNNGYAVEITAGDSDDVVLTNALITAGSNGLGALKFSSGGKILLSEDVFHGNETAFGPIIALYPNNPGTTQAQVYFSHSDIGFNNPNSGGAGAIEVKPYGSTSMKLHFNHVEVHNASYGIRTDGSMLSSPSAVVASFISESEFFSFPNAAVNAFSTSGTGTVNAVFDFTRILNAGVALKANGPQSFVVVTNNTIGGNTIGLQQQNGATVITSHNSTVNGNGLSNNQNVSGTLTQAPLQ